MSRVVDVEINEGYYWTEEDGYEGYETNWVYVCTLPVLVANELSHQALEEIIRNHLGIGDPGIHFDYRFAWVRNA